MGQPKALLPFGEETLLSRVVRILSGVVDPVVVVAAADQELPELPAAVRIVRDVREYAGPLAGMHVGLAALASDADAVYISACDAPLLRPAFVRAMVAALGEHDAAVPRDGKFYHPLAGVYRTSLAGRIASLLDAERLRPLYLIESVKALAVGLDDLRAADPALDSLRNLNTMQEYRDALRDGGISAEPH